jgi:hypothetical protein
MNFILQRVKSMRYILDFADSKFSTRNLTECHGRKKHDDDLFKFASYKTWSLIFVFYFPNLARHNLKARAIIPEPQKNLNRKSVRIFMIYNQIKLHLYAWLLTCRCRDDRH